MPDGMWGYASFGETAMYLSCAGHCNVEAQGVRDVATRHRMILPVWQQCGICPQHWVALQSSPDFLNRTFQ